MVGMDKKPFHVMRLKKALNKPTTSKSHTPDSKGSKNSVSLTPGPTPPPSNSTNSASSSQSMLSSHLPKPSPSSNQLAVAGPFHRHKLSEEQPLGVVGVSEEQSQRSLNQDFLNAIEKSTNSLPNIGLSNASPNLTLINIKPEDDKSKTLFLPPYLQENSDSRSFDELIDDQTPLQKTLGPCPFQPSMWDPERKELIRKYASIYGKNFNKRQKELLTPFEEQVNEGAYQLCLRDPTLLVRREELFVLAKRAVKEGGYTYYHGYSKGKELESTIATTGQKRLRRTDSSHLEIPSKILITSDLVDDIPKKMSGRMRQERMVELERLIASNKTQQAAKLVELEQAQQLCNFSTAFSIQLEVESLGNACQQLQTSYAALKRKQRRSDRYYNMKEREGQLMGDEESGTKDDKQQGVSVAGNNSLSSPTALEKRTFVYIRTPRSSTGNDSTQSTKAGSTTRPAVTATVIPSSQQQGATATTAGGHPQGPSPHEDSTSGGGTGEDSEVRDLVENVSHATDEVNSLMIREFQKQLAWDL